MMADPNDPLAGYVAPKAAKPTADDPLAGYQPPAPTAAAAAQPSQPTDLGTTALWNKPANTSWGDYLLAHLTQPFQGAGQAAHDYGLTAADLASLGMFDPARAALTGTPVAAERKSTAEAYGRLPTGMAPIMGAGIYAAGPGSLGIAKGLGEAAAPALGKWLGGVAGSAVEGSGAGLIGAAAHGEDPNQGAMIGGALGALGGVPGGIVGRGGTLPPAVSEDALRKEATAAFAPLDAMVFHGPSQIKPALDAVTNTMTDAEKDLAKATMAKVNKLGEQNLVTGGDLQEYQRLLGDAANTGGTNDRQYAPQFKKAIQGVMETVEPYGRNLTPKQGMSLMLPGPLGGTGFRAGDAAAAKAAGNVPYGRAQDVARLSDMQEKATRGAADVGAQTKSWLPSEEGLKYAPPGSPALGAWNAIAKTAGPPQTPPLSGFDVRHLVSPLIGAGIGGALGLSTGADPARLTEEIAMGAAVPAIHKIVPWTQGTFQRAAQQRAIDAGRVAFSTGQAQAPVLPAANFRDFLRNMIYGQGARGAF